MRRLYQRANILQNHYHTTAPGAADTLPETLTNERGTSPRPTSHGMGSRRSRAGRAGFQAAGISALFSRGLAGTCLTLLLCVGLSAGRAETVAPSVELSTRDLSADARKAATQRLPILLLFSAEHCGFCDRLKEDYLVPMAISGDYQDRVLIRILDISGIQPVRDLDGRRVMPEVIADRYRVAVTPTLLFLDGKGGRLLPPMVGYNSPELFGLYLDAAIDEARSIIRAK